ncbi:MAG: glutamate-5-semialdehyde dehydrogenase [Paludibacteraceae bacterium]|nr:glutamate-5-semialdehyde dehydrogenase [Paludibacteraceae bacterium]MBR6043849.1 glutamate-5-semialdehyde dehydrogenase [Paludibacteraceae bacterium]
MDLTKVFQQVKAASRSLTLISKEKTNEVLVALASEVEAKSADILAANAKDLAKKDPKDPTYDRLKLTEERLKGIADGIRDVAKLPSPIGRTIDERVRPNGLKIKRISVPFGVIGIIYEARPNVSLDVFSLCFKSGNACVLKGGTDAHESNSAIVNVIHDVLKKQGVNEDIVALLPAGRESTGEMLNARGYIDVIIPRGSAGLIRFVNENAKVPVIETGAGTCHTYFDEKGDVEKGKNIVFNSKTRRPSVCNTLDTIIIHSKRLADLPAICEPCASKNVIIYADEASFKVLEGNYPANLLEHAGADDFGKEWLDYKMSVKTVNSIDEALEHIQTYGTGHSEAIVSEDQAACDKFVQMVDAACVYTNAPTSFSDGGEFGLGAEIGISTQKMHARGPMGLEELNTYKWVIAGNGQVR